MISEDALERIEFIRKKYEIPGLAIGVVGPTGVHSNGDLEEASFTFGVRNPDGDPYDEDVSPEEFFSGTAGCAPAGLSSVDWLMSSLTPLECADDIRHRIKLETFFGSLTLDSNGQGN